jgi:tetratricopeptide (TPR) repeat protein
VQSRDFTGPPNGFKISVFPASREDRKLTLSSRQLLNQRARQVSIQLKVASAWVDRALGRDADALALMQEAAKAEETSETHDTLSPGPIGMTAHEALGLLLLELGRPSEAFEAFEASLRSSKNRLRSYAGAAAAAASVGNTAAARDYYAKLLELADGGTRPELARAKAYLNR